jgi:hypothetical protein
MPVKFAYEAQIWCRSFHWLFLSICHRQETAFSIIRLIGRVYCAVIAPAAYFFAPQRAVSNLTRNLRRHFVELPLNKFDESAPVSV